MKRILLIALALICGICHAQTFKVQNLDVLGTSAFAVRPTFNGNTPWDSGNFNPSSYATLSGPAFTGLPTAPTQAQFDNSTKIATDTFVQRALGNDQSIIELGSSTTLTASESGSYIVMNTAGTATLPAISSMTPASVFYFTSSTGGASVKTSGSDLIYVGSQTLSTLLVNPGDSVMISTDGGNWIAKIVAHQHCLNVMDYGGNNIAGANNDAAFTAALNAQGYSNQKCIYFPAGYYNFSSSGLSYTLPNGSVSLTIEGDGSQVSNLYWASGSGLTVTSGGLSQNNSVHIRGLSFLTGSAGTNTAIFLDNTASSGQPVPSVTSDFTDVTVGTTAGSNYWAFGISANNWSFINFNSVTVYGGSGGGDLPGYTGEGVGIALTATAPPFGVVYNVVGGQFNYLEYGISYGANIQGLAVSQTNFVGGKIGIYVPAVSGTTQLTVIGSQFNDSDYGILDQSGVAATMIENNLFIIPEPTSSNAGISLQKEFESIISGNVFQRAGAAATGTNGVVIGSNSGADGVITGNVFYNLQSAVVLGSTSSGMNVQSNAYSGNSTNVANSGTGNTVGGGSP